MEDNFSSIGSVALAAYIITFNSEMDNSLVDVAKHLATAEMNHSIAILQDLPEIVIMHPIGKRHRISIIVELFIVSLQTFVHAKIPLPLKKSN